MPAPCFIPLSSTKLGVPDFGLRLPHCFLLSTMASMSAELVSIICEHLASTASQGTLATVALCSNAVNNIAVPILYRRLELTRENADIIFCGVPRVEYDYTSPSKEEYETELAAFNAKWHDSVDPGHKPPFPPFGTEADEPEDDDDEDEVDGQHAAVWADLVPDDNYDEAAAVAASNDANWDRRLDLLEHCQTLTIASVPRPGLVRDLLVAAAIHVNYINATEWSENPDAWPIFPNLKQIAFSAAAVSYIADYELAHKSDNEPEMYDFGDGSHDESQETYFPFGHLVQFAFGAPQDVCIIAPTTTVPRSTMVFNTLRMPASKMRSNYAFEASYGHRGYEATIASQLSALAFYSLPKKVNTVTYHRMRGPAASKGRAELFRLFYHLVESPLASGEDRARDILADLALQDTWSTEARKLVQTVDELELIDVECDTDATEEAIRLAVEQGVAANPKRYQDTEIDFVPEDTDAQLAQELADANAELDEIGPLLETWGSYRSYVEREKANVALEAALGTAGEEEARTNVAFWEEKREAIERRVKELTEASEKARTEAREKRVLASSKPRVVYTAGANAEPCVVCGATHVEA
ncbi:uncharacterized protein LOC62_05G007358 [Vanrija pseudolonga]|uniref:Uncharacterized protein n=1 Tax=Vanrija pseudolonga TaxID=143232 RepID=A0AAF0YF75_9TREE|nr:hypothetical protein LOC62_05G007358 [Vanrija pseudolonga]